MEFDLVEFHTVAESMRQFLHFINDFIAQHLSLLAAICNWRQLLDADFVNESVQSARQ